MTELLVFSLHPVSYLADGQLEHYFKSSYIPIMNRLMNYLLFGAKVWCFQIEKKTDLILHSRYLSLIINFQKLLFLSMVYLISCFLLKTPSIIFFQCSLTKGHSVKMWLSPALSDFKAWPFFLLSSCPDPLTVLTSIYDDLTILQLPITSQICDLTTWKFLIHSTFPISVATAIFST